MLCWCNPMTLCRAQILAKHSSAMLRQGTLIALFLKPHSHPIDCYWRHQSSWALIPSNQRRECLHHAVWQLQEEITRPKLRFKLTSQKNCGANQEQSAAKISWSVAPLVLVVILSSYYHLPITALVGLPYGAASWPSIQRMHSISS